MSRLTSRYRVSDIWRVRRAVIGGLAAFLALALLPGSGDAGVVHIIGLDIGDDGVQRQVFGVQASDIDTDIQAQLSNFGPVSNRTGFPGGHLTGSIGRDGSFGLGFIAFGDFSGSLGRSHVVNAQVIIASDQFVNLSNRPTRVVSRVIVDGGSLQMHGATNIELTYGFRLGMLNLGTNAFGIPSGLVDDVQTFGGIVHTAGGALIADENGGLEFTSHGGGLDAFFNPLSSSVTIPLSFQTFDLGILGPRDRGVIVYDFVLRAEARGHRVDGFAPLSDRPDGIFAQYSDPLSLSSNPGFTIEFLPTADPVPEPSTLTLALSGLVVLGLVRFIRRKRSAA